MDRRGQSGMTLVETLVALAILAGVVLSAYAMLAQSTRFASIEQDRLIAGIVADNQTIEMMISQTPPDPGEEALEVEAADQRWLANRVVTEFGEDLLRITVTVSRAGEAQVLARVETLRAAP